MCVLGILRHSSLSARLPREATFFFFGGGVTILNMSAIVCIFFFGILRAQLAAETAKLDAESASLRRRVFMQGFWLVLVMQETKRCRHFGFDILSLSI